jgi:quinol-cytochrome oxidoreductase complex cytochrome b subunit
MNASAGRSFAYVRFGEGCLLGLREVEWQSIDLPTRLVALVTNNRVWRSIFRFPYPSDDRARALIIPAVFFLHIHPLKVDVRSIRLTYTWGLGLFLFFLFLIETFTGILLMFVYVPHVDRAYADVQAMGTTIPFGTLLRNVHRWGAHLMVLAVFLHMARVFYTGAYKSPREFNWVIGVMLLLLTLALSFTGYLLPWDQLSFWAITVSTNLAGYTPLIGEPLRMFILGGKEVGQDALIRFYTAHVILLPLLMTVLIGLHFWRIRKDGGLAASHPLPRGVRREPAPAAPATAGEDDDPPEDAEAALPMPGARPRPSEATAASRAPAARAAVARKQTVSTWPNLLILEIIAGLFITAVLVLMSLAVDAPLRDLANPDVTENPAKAPWYFLNLQELLLHMDAALAGVWIPGLLIVGLIVLPYLDRDLSHAGEWFGTRKGLVITIWSAVYTAVWMTALVIFDENVGVRSIVGEPAIVPNWVIPVGVTVGLMAILHASILPLRPSRREILMAYFTGFIVAYAHLTIVGSFFRGIGMHLVEPWNLPPGGLSF